MRIVCLLLVIWLGLCALRASAADQNLVLHKAYDYWPVPDYDRCQDAGDATQLTDGAISSAPAMWLVRSTVGWSNRGAQNFPTVIHFDLGQEATVRELGFSTCLAEDAGIRLPALTVYISLDGKHFVVAGERPSSPGHQAGRSRVVLKVSLHEARARYVAVVARPPAPSYFVFVDEIELMGRIPADPQSFLPVQPGVTTDGTARSLQELLAGGRRNSDKLHNLIAPIERHLTCWPRQPAASQRKELDRFCRRALVEPNNFDAIRSELTAGHRDRARQVYGAETLVWEVPPDDAFTMLSLPEVRSPPQAASIHTVVNALEATALGVANLTTAELPLTIRVSASGGPPLTVRVARFFVTSNARYVPDALLAWKEPYRIPPGESRLIWLEAESTGAKAGVYHDEVRVRLGPIKHRIPVTVHVHNVTLSRSTPLANGNWDYLNTGEGPVLKDVRDSMLSHRITAGTMSGCPLPKKDAHGKVLRPVELDFAPLDKALVFYKDFPHLTLFFPFNHSAAQPCYDWFGPAPWMSDEFKQVFGEWIGQVIRRIKASGRDYEAFSFQMFDETLDEKVGLVCRLVHAVDPNVRMMITIPQASREATQGLVAAGMNIFTYHAPRLGYANPPDGFDVLSSGGRELWLYNAADAEAGVGKECDPLGWYRCLYWTAFRYQATGVRFWNMLSNNGYSPIWTEEAAGYPYYPLVYPVGLPANASHPPPPDVTTIENVIPSRRWEYVRMGIEDFLLLSQARQRIAALGSAGSRDQAQLEVIVRTVMNNRNTDRALFRAKHRELIELVERLATPR